MSIVQVTEKERQLAHTLAQAAEALKQTTYERDRLRLKVEYSEAWESNAKRLALELECLLLSCDLPAASKWWDSAHEAMELHRQLISSIYKDAEEKS